MNHNLSLYVISRNLRKLKNNVRNKAQVEGFICNAYLVEEASSFCSHYFEPHVYTRHRKVPRNDDGGTREKDEHDGNLSIFTYPGKAFGRCKTKIYDWRRTWCSSYLCFIKLPRGTPIYWVRLQAFVFIYRLEKSSKHLIYNFLRCDSKDFYWLPSSKFPTNYGEGSG